MCGIIGIIKKDRAIAADLLAGLRRVAYRGYDSAGIATLIDGHIERRRAKGKLESLEICLASAPIGGATGIGHTRWATHGAPSEENAHPHVSADGRVAIVHNGIIENKDALRHVLAEAGLADTLTSETDTEVLAFLIGLELARGAPTLAEGVRCALRKVEGAYGIAVISADYPGEIVAARRGSPIVIGERPDGERFVGSDPKTFAEHTRHVDFLEEGELAILRFDEPTRIERIRGAAKSRGSELQEIDSTEALSGKEGHPHFMHKELWETPAAVGRTLLGRTKGGDVKIGAFADPETANRLRDTERIVILACGTSLFAGRVGKLLIERFADVPVEAVYASEWRYGARLVSSKDAVIAVSQSGETADTLEALREAKKRGVLHFGITNCVGSTLARETEPSGMYLHAGPEIAVASTKAFACQVAALSLFAVALGTLRTGRTQKRFVSELGKLPNHLKEVLSLEEQIARIANAYKDATCMPIIGRGFNAPVADEGALKLWELPYLSGAHGWPAGEMKHGPIALIEPGTPVVAIVPKDALRAKVMSNISEACARGATIIALTTGSDEEVEQLVGLNRNVLRLPATAEELYPVEAALALQMFAYHMAVARGTDVDQPRNLAKSVTVE